MIFKGVLPERELGFIQWFNLVCNKTH